jgi:phosphatidylinositol-bisphosphatase
VFYFSISADPNNLFDLTLSSQSKYFNHESNKKFLWNYNLHIPFRRFNVDTSKWLLKIICGCVEIKKVVIYSRAFKACLFSRLSCERVGARFYCRGVDDHGNCANFVETEQVVYSTDTDEESSFVQLRGSVPVFFEQTGLQVGSHKIKILRSNETCYPSFERHINSLIQEYGPNLFILNLLGIKGDEDVLTKLYECLCETTHYSMKSELIYKNFDYHSQMKTSKSLSNTKLWYDLYHKFYKSDFHNGAFFETTCNTETNKLDFKHQTRFIRTNCMDCLDRTNSVQSFIGIEMLKYQLAKVINKESDLNKFRDVFRQIWILNGDSISKIYAGTSAIQGKSVTQDLTRSLSRAIQNNFLDGAKQNIIDTFLFSISRSYSEILAEQIRVLMSQNFLRLPYSVLREMISLKENYATKLRCRISAGTYNINGGFTRSDMNQLNLNEWLINGPHIANKTNIGYLDPSYNPLNDPNEQLDIFAIGFEEIVDLSAQNIVNASEENANEWRQKILECISKKGDYAELIVENLQLVGVCLYVFVLKKHVGAIRDINITRTKTGMGGAAGNKGAAVIRLTFYNTSLCFVCAHFAAHQKEIKQRNEDFKQIYEQSEFVRKKELQISNHDYVFWLGDLNYRIDLPNDRCRSLIAEQDYKTLLEFEQLSIQRSEKNVFKDFNEAPILFPPTYKYNVFEDTYDRSEKCRVPAWTGIFF